MTSKRYGLYDNNERGNATLVARGSKRKLRCEAIAILEARYGWCDELEWQNEIQFTHPRSKYAMTNHVDLFIAPLTPADDD